MIARDPGAETAMTHPCSGPVLASGVGSRSRRLSASCWSSSWTITHTEDIWTYLDIDSIAVALASESLLP